jgi:hypothetical protein
MAERRTLSAAIDVTAEKMAYIRSGTAAVPPVAVATSVAHEEAQNAALEESTPSAQKKRSRPRFSDYTPSTSKQNRVQTSTPFLDQILVPLTTRIRPETANALRRICLERKLRREKPDSAQDIVELALHQWLTSQSED